MMITLLNYDDDDVSTRVADQIFIALKTVFRGDDNRKALLFRDY
jgi:hypothetical protein